MTAYNACRLDVEQLGATYAAETLHVDGNLVLRPCMARSTRIYAGIYPQT